MLSTAQLEGRLYLDKDYYFKLTREGQSLFDYSEEDHLFYSAFPIEEMEDQSTLDCITAYCEVSLIPFNPIYAITENTSLSCEIFHLGQSPNLFTLLITIRYDDSKDFYHDLLTFEILHQTDKLFAFKLLGDQTLFSLETLSSHAESSTNKFNTNITH